jgi:hypothetical protein
VLAERDPSPVGAPLYSARATTCAQHVHRNGRATRRTRLLAGWLLVVVLVAALIGVVHVVQLTTSDRPNTRFGASPMNHSIGPSVTAKWGVGASLRVFAQDIAAPTHPVGASTVHTSFALLDYGVSRDQALRDVTAGKYDTQIAAAAKGASAGDAIELVHEADKKIADGITTWPVVLAAKNHFHDVAKAANSSGSTAMASTPQRAPTRTTTPRSPLLSTSSRTTPPTVTTTGPFPSSPPAARQQIPTAPSALPGSSRWRTSSVTTGLSTSTSSTTTTPRGRPSRCRRRSRPGGPSFTDDPNAEAGPRFSRCPRTRCPQRR